MRPHIALNPATAGVFLWHCLSRLAKRASGNMFAGMTGPLTEHPLSLLRRAAAADHISAATAEEKTALDELVEKDLIRHDQLTEAGWRELREAYHDRGSE
jgi:hypothetical protein